MKLFAGISDSSVLNSASMTSLADVPENILKHRSRSPLTTLKGGGVHFKRLFRGGTASNGGTSSRKSSLKHTATSSEVVASEKVGASIKCPKCEYVTVVAMGGLNRLPRHLLLQRKLDSERQRLQKEALERLRCSQCDEQRSVRI